MRYNIYKHGALIHLILKALKVAIIIAPLIALVMLAMVVFDLTTLSIDVNYNLFLKTLFYIFCLVFIIVTIKILFEASYYELIENSIIVGTLVGQKNKIDTKTITKICFSIKHGKPMYHLFDTKLIIILRNIPVKKMKELAMKFEIEFVDKTLEYT